MPGRRRPLKREHPFLVWTLHRALGLPAASPEPAEWAAGAVDVEVSRLAPLAAQLLGPDLRSLPETPYRNIARAVGLAGFAAERGAAQLTEMRDLLEGAGVPWLVMKGPPMAERLYGSGAIRPSRDLDVLVPWASVEEVTRFLTDRGYSPWSSPSRELFHVRFQRPYIPGWDDILEVHWRIEPPSAGSPGTAEMLAHRRAWGEGMWIPSPAHELELLIRHYIRHGGWQAILLLDVLLHLGDTEIDHPLGAILADDLRRLGLPERIRGPGGWTQAPLRRWMGTRTWLERRRARAPIAAQLALQHAPSAWMHGVASRFWPARPSARWRELAEHPVGRHTWRLRRLMTFGRRPRQSEG